MLYLDENNIIEQLRKLAVFLNANFEEGYGAAKLELDNENGKGYINSYEISQAISVRTYNIEFFKEVKFKKNESVMNPLYFLYCLQGHYYHKFDHENEAVKISQLQNVILSSTTNKQNIVILPARVPLKLSVIFLMQDKLEQTGQRKNLGVAIEDIFAYVDENVPYKYLGELNVETAEYAKILINNKRTDAVGRLLTEASVINTLASQLDAHDKNKEGVNFNNPLSKTELNQIIKLSDYVSKNISFAHSIESLSKKSGIHPKKLQKGFRFLFGKSVKHFVRELRLEHAKDLIQSTNLTISEITYSVGISSRSYFSKIFYGKFGIHPNKYRDSFLKSDQFFELSYKSKSKVSITNSEIKNIVNTSRANNKKLNVTGCLIYYENNFFQLLEGSKSAVLNTYNKILKDTRHSEVELIWKGAKKNRIFDEWSLGLITEAGVFHNQKNTPSLSINLKSILTDVPESGIVSKLFWIQMKNMIKVGNLNTTKVNK